ncbi:tetratricopeptide repeat protein [Vibrio sp. HN007]|uniref:tetratricopeptide repeat protein n=1 Tax=Vibrio iocasae TaxID=3098914 RepID=UPI0035D4B094
MTLQQSSNTPTQAQNLYLMAANHLKGVLKEADSEVAIGYLEQASELGLCEAQYQLGVIYAEGTLRPRDLKYAQQQFGVAAEQGFVPAKFALATLHAEFDEYEKSFELFKELADSDVTEAQTNLANMYLLGLGTEKDVNTAIYYLTKAAEKGDRLARYRLGEIYYRGDDVVSNYLLARQYVVQAMEQKYLPAYLIMASMLEHGYGITQDVVRAYSLYRFCQQYGMPGLSELMSDILSNLEPLDAERAKALAEEYCNHEPIPV